MMAKSKKTLVIDGQVFQTEAKDRGMGRYSVCLVQSLVRGAEYEAVEIVLTKNLPHGPRQLDELKTLFAGAKLTLLDLKIARKGGVGFATKHNKNELNKFISSRADLNDSLYLILSLFQEPTVSVFPANVQRLLVMYDIIPYLYHERYEPIMQYESYLRRFKYIFEADQIFAISQSVADDLRTYLGVPDKRLTCIDGAPIRTNHDLVKPSQSELPASFVLMPTSDDLRKNNLRAVLGFEEYCSSSNADGLKLVVTSKIRKRERDHLRMFSDRLVFTGNLSDAELNWLYQNSEAVLFVPESEGLGLPVLEGAEAGKKIVCSSIPVFKEISEDCFFYCDNKSQHSIAQALAQALNPDNTVPKAEYKAILKHYSWPETAKRFASWRPVAEDNKEVRHKPNIAVFAPRPDGLSAIGKVVSELHPTLSEHFNIDYYIEMGMYAKHVRPNYLKYVANYYPATDFGAKKYSQYDGVIYHIGNGDYHLESIKNGLCLPGYAIVHDTNIGEAYRVLEELKMMSAERVGLEKLLNQKAAVKHSQYMVSLLSNQLGVLTHSNYAKQAAREIVDADVEVIVANLPSAAPKLHHYAAKDNLVIGLAGIIADVKGIEVVELIANDPDYKDCEIVLFGFNYATQDTIDRLNFYENVTVMTNLTDFEFQENLRKLDIFVNFRLEYKGETSLSTIEAMKNGVCVMVRDTGWYSELPDGTVVKVTTQKEVLDRLKELKQNPDKLRQIKTAGKQHIASDFTHEQFALALGKLISSPIPPQKTQITKDLSARKIRTPRQYIKVLQRRIDD